MAAPAGNHNARRVVRGTQVNFYLSASDTQELVKLLNAEGESATEEMVRRYAREAAKNGIALEIHGPCSIPGCWYAGDSPCTQPSENGYCPGKFCQYHYEQIHLPSDERETIDRIVKRKLFE